LDEERIAIPDAIVALRSYPRRWREAFTAAQSDGGDELLTRRPEPETWSAVEYAAHTRDVFRLLAAGLEEVLRRDRPDFGHPPDPDETARAYADLDADTVLTEFGDASTALADRAERVPAQEWSRPFVVDGGEHHAGWIVQHAAHEGSHHLRDVERGFATLRAEAPR
jgi:S-DNA-T family DNA segregation ATPase FtsK/SpoIIIE